MEEIEYILVNRDLKHLSLTSQKQLFIILTMYCGLTVPRAILQVPVSSLEHFCCPLEQLLMLPSSSCSYCSLAQEALAQAAGQQKANWKQETVGQVTSAQAATFFHRRAKNLFTIWTKTI